MGDEASFKIGGGGFQGPTATPLGSGVARALGQQGGGLPGLSADPGIVQPVFVVGDTSQSLSRALGVRRGWMGRRTVVAAGLVFAVGMRGYASAGVVIEQLRIVAAPGGALVTPFNVAAAYLLPANFIPGIAIGGTDMNQFIGGATEGVHFETRASSGVVQIQSPVQAWNPNDTPVFIPPGSRLVVETADLGVDVDWEIVWREVPE